MGRHGNIEMFHLEPTGYKEEHLVFSNDPINYGWYFDTLAEAVRECDALNREVFITGEVVCT